MSAQPSPFSILCVCTGNICRSPAAELLLQDRLGPDVEVASAGTRAMVGNQMSAEMAALARGAGLDPDPFVARMLNPMMIRDADLILGMTRAHRAATVDLWPATVRRAFTLREFARLLQLVDPAQLPAAGVAGRLRAAVPLAAAHRRRVGDIDDIADPYGREDTAYAAAYAEVTTAVETIAAVISRA